MNDNAITPPFHCSTNRRESYLCRGCGVRLTSPSYTLWSDARGRIVCDDCKSKAEAAVAPPMNAVPTLPSRPTRLSEAALREHRHNAESLRMSMVTMALQLANLAARYDRTMKWMGSHCLSPVGPGEATVNCLTCSLPAVRTGSHGMNAGGDFGEVLTCGCLLPCAGATR